jgi:hypothetical protein
MVTTPIKPVQKSNPIKVRLERVLCNTFPGAEIRLEPDPYSIKVAIQVVWEGFEFKTVNERHALLRKAIHENFSEEELDLILFWSTLTSNEDRSIAEDF